MVRPGGCKTSEDNLGKVSCFGWGAVRLAWPASPSKNYWGLVRKERSRCGRFTENTPNVEPTIFVARSQGHNDG